MFTKIDPIKKGGRVALKFKYETTTGIFSKGHEFKVTNVSGNYYDVVDDDGRKLDDIHFSYFERPEPLPDVPDDKNKV